MLTTIPPVIINIEIGVGISIFQEEGTTITEHIYSRLQYPQLPMRRTQDPSFLIHGLVDAVEYLFLTVLLCFLERRLICSGGSNSFNLQIVDHYLPVVEFYNKQVNALHELTFEIGANASFTKTLHLASRELSILRRTLAPTESLIKALQDMSTETLITSGDELKFSAMTKTYFGDVMVGYSLSIVFVEECLLKLL